MKISELVKSISKLSKHYTVDADEYVLDIAYKGHRLLRVHEKVQYSFEQFDSAIGELHKFPYSNKLYMLVAEYSMTPIEERDDNPEKYYVKVPHTDNEYYWKFDDDELRTTSNRLVYLGEKQFTRKEIKQWGLEDYERVEVDHE